MTTIIDAIKMCEDKIKIYQNDTKYRNSNRKKT